MGGQRIARSDAVFEVLETSHPAHGVPAADYGCGHNVICAAGVGAFLAAALLVEQLGGTLGLLGTPAEENGTGKAIMG